VAEKKLFTPQLLGQTPPNQVTNELTTLKSTANIH